MKRLIITLGLVAFGCETNETSISILHVLAPETPSGTDGCELDPGGAVKSGPVSLDTAASLAVSLPLVVSNNLSARETDYGFGGIDSPVTTRADVTPLRFDARFECDTSAYSGSAAGGLLLPRIDAADSFCIDKRADAEESKFNSDVLPVAGAAIPAAGTGVTVVKAIPHELGYAIDELFTIAVLADQCCNASLNCSGLATEPSCTRLQQIFEEVDENGNLSAVGQPNVPNPSLQDYAAYAVYDGIYISGVDATYGSASTPAFPMNLRGTLIGVTGYGDVVVSNDFSAPIDVCRNCGYTAMNGHGPRAEFGCIRE